MYKDFSDCTNLNKVSKTVRFELIPEGKTLENIEAGGLLCSDIKRAEDFAEYLFNATETALVLGGEEKTFKKDN